MEGNNFTPQFADELTNLMFEVHNLTELVAARYNHKEDFELVAVSDRLRYAVEALDATMDGEV